jgi:branched-chain amino acid transport system permease protein
MRNPWAQTGNYRTSYRQDTSIFATHRELVSLLLFLAFLLVLPQFLQRTQVFILDLILVYSVAVLGLNITTGYAGLINIGQAAFMGVGAYAAALLAPMGLPFYSGHPPGGAGGRLLRLPGGDSEPQGQAPLPGPGHPGLPGRL